MVFALVSSADFNQAAECLPAWARGRQCVPTCLMFLITANAIRPCIDMETNCLNSILIAGSKLYCALHQPNSTSDLIDPALLLLHVSYRRKSLYMTSKKVFSGCIEDGRLLDNVNFHKLEIGLAKACTVGKHFILVFSGVSVGIYFKNPTFYIFDSHSRDINGMSCPDGKCILGCVQSLSDLCTHLRSLSRTITVDSASVQYDLHVFSINQTFKRCSVTVHILDDSLNLNIKEKNHHHLAPVQQKKRNRDTDTENEAAVQKRPKHDTDTLISQFDKLVSTGPDYVCSCCTQTFFRHSVVGFEKIKGSKKTFLSNYLTNYLSFDNIEWVCCGCVGYASREQVPKLWAKNGLQFPNKPSQLNLSELEERLVSPRLPFMQLREMPRGGQINLKGNVVNVPADVNSTIKSLPRMIDENQTIMLKLKRKLSYKHHVAFENIRPNKVFEAAKWLVKNSILFRNEGIVINETWLQHTQEISSYPEQTGQDEETEDNNENSESNDNWTEDDNFSERPTGNLDTCLQSADFREYNQILSVAPGEKNSPIGLYQDIHSEALSFPSIYCGQFRVNNSERKVSLYYSDVCKWELRNVDRRVALCVPNIFYKLKRLQIKQIKDKVLLAVRKCKAKGKVFTAGELLAPGFVDKLTMQNDGYRVLRTLRGSPPYWEAAKRDVFAMIRQLGIPTWFCSFSAAETKWTPLLKSLAHLVQGRNLSADQIAELSWQEKCTLIKSDPVTCTRYFEHRVQNFIRHVLNHKLQPIGKILDYFYRVEFQQRGSPHIHMVIWIQGAPVPGESSDKLVSEFVNKYVSCSRDETMPELVNYQTHRHTQTCKKFGKSVCRFNFPIPPMPETSVLHPFDRTEKRSTVSEEYQHLMAYLNDLHQSGRELQFSEFLAEIGLDFDSYIQIVRSTLTRPKVFLKRSISENRINNYNKILLKCWKANMDIQYILDPYSCVSYIVSYIAKGQRGLSNLLKDACNEAREMDSDVRQQVRRIGNQFLSNVEIGAQEAAYLVLQMPLRRCTRDVVYVDTNKLDDRTSMMKPLSELKDLKPNSKNVEMDNTMKRYKRRPKILEQLCYADFASWYNTCKKSKEPLSFANDCEQELPETEYEDNADDDLENDEEDTQGRKVITFACGTQVQKRLRQKVIYHHATAMSHDSEEHFREKIMLYTHWRDDEKDLMGTCTSYEQSYNNKAEEINTNKEQYEKKSASLDSMENLEDEDFETVIHPEGQHQDLIDAEEGPSKSILHGCFDPGSGANELEGYDLGDDIGISRTNVRDLILPNKEIDNEDYLQSIRKLNHEQKRFFYYILHKVKMKYLPFYTFLSGGAGCGKSVLIRAIYQALLKHFNHSRGENPDSTNLLLCAPTGKAAHNIGGSTIHSAFCIPASQGFHFKPLDMQQLNTMRVKFHNLKVVIIDEISMVGRAMFNFINLRLQEIKGCTNPFGNVSILAVGDLYQLKPVLDSWIFSTVYRTTQLQCIGTSLWVDLFYFYELQEIMRQKEDCGFALLLNRLREGKQTDEDMRTLERRSVEYSNDAIAHLPHLFCKRIDASLHNGAIISKKPSSETINIEAIDTVSGSISSSLHDVIISKIPLDSNKTMGLQKHLVLGIDLPAELCSNVDTSDGLTNGAACCIRNFDFRVEGSSRCSIVWVEFDDPSVGKKWRVTYKHLYQKNISMSWTPVLEINRHFTYRYFKTYLIVRRQFPLYMSAGKTIHKAQGSTIKGAVLHFGTRKIDHVHYVGLSRMTSLSGVHILQLNSSKISVSSEVEVEMNRLRTERVIKEEIPNLCEKNGLKICFQNCRSLRQHVEDIRHETNLICADIIGFVETRLPCSSDEEYKIDGFHTIMSDTGESAHGIAVYYKHGIQIEQFSIKTFFGIECAVLSIENLVICFVYCPPRYASVSRFSDFLSVVVNDTLGQCYVNRKMVLLGDFNYDYLAGNVAVSKLFLDKFGFRQLINDVTTDYDSCLDHIYTNMPLQDLHSSGILESYYSDHKPVFLSTASTSQH